jgi:hypothetical protein
MVSLEDINIDKIDFEKASGTKEDFVNWIEKYGDNFDSFRELWLDVDTKVISAVDKPSHDSEIVQIKSENDTEEKSVDVLQTEKYTSKSEDKNIIVAPAMVSNSVDKDGDIVPDYVVEESAHKFLKEKRVDEIDYQHETRTGSDRSITERGSVVESWIQEDEKEYETINGDKKTYGNGDWMVAIELNSEVLEKVKSGEVTGLSMMGIPKEMIQNKSASNTSKDTEEQNPLQMEQDNDSMGENTESEKEEKVQNILDNNDLTADELIEALDTEKEENTEEVDDEKTEDVEVETEDETEETEDTETEKMDMEKITDMLEEVLDRVEDLEEDFYEDDEDTDVEDDETEETEDKKEENTEDVEDEKTETDEGEEKSQEKGTTTDNGYVPVWEREPDNKNVSEGTQEKSQGEDGEDDKYTDWF